MPNFIIALILSATVHLPIVPFNFVVLPDDAWERLKYPGDLGIIYSCPLKYIHVRSSFIIQFKLQRVEVQAFITNACKGESS